MKPFLKWAGGKRRLVETLASLVPSDYGTYYEPFVGAGALFFHLQPKAAIINDSNRELMNVYRVIQDDLEPLLVELDKLKSQTDKDSYLRIRDVESSNLGSIARAARFIYLNKTCFNGLFRVNALGKFNVPYGNRKNPKIVDRELLTQARDTLVNAAVLNLDYTDICKMPVAGDLVYFDPPYDPLSKTSNFTSYTKDGFYESDQIKLAEQFKSLVDRGVSCILSNNDTPLIRRIYSGYNFVEVKSMRSIAANDQSRGKVTELVVTNL